LRKLIHKRTAFVTDGIERSSIIHRRSSSLTYWIPAAEGKYATDLVTYLQGT